MSVNLFSPADLLAAVAKNAKARRLAYGLRQADLASAAGVAIATVRRFEAGQAVGFDAVVAIALALRAEGGFIDLFPAVEQRSLEDILASQKHRVRARKRS